VYVPHKDIQRCLKINPNLVLFKESTAAKGVGTTVDKTTIPVLLWAIKSNGNVTPFSPVYVAHTDI
jgi:hypothetical protein